MIPTRTLRYTIVQNKERGTWSGSFVLNTAKGEVSFEVFGAKDGEARWQPTDDFLLALAEGALGGAIERVDG